MTEVIKKCPTCKQNFVSKFDNNFCDYCIESERLEEDGLYITCPACGKDYDEIDYEYQICHYCKHKAK